MKQTTVRIDDELLKEVKRLLIDLDISYNDYILDLIRKDLENRKFNAK